MSQIVNPALTTLEGKVTRIARIIDEAKGEEITVLDLRGISDFADAFVIATLRGNTHLRATLERIEDELRDEGVKPMLKPDKESTRWAVLDYADVIVHLFDAEARAYYSLEALWGDAASMAWPEVALA